MNQRRLLVWGACGDARSVSRRIGGLGGRLAWRRGDHAEGHGDDREAAGPARDDTIGGWYHQVMQSNLL